MVLNRRNDAKILQKGLGKTGQMKDQKKTDDKKTRGAENERTDNPSNTKGSKGVKEIVSGGT